MRAPARLAGIGVAALIGVASLTVAVAPPGRALAANDTSWFIHSETTDRQTSDTVGGVTTHTETVTTTTNQTSSDGQSWDENTTLQKNADGSGSEHVDTQATRADGSNGSSTEDSTWDSNGRFTQSTSNWTDANGNRTTWTDWEQFDAQGHSLRKGSDVKKDKVTPPTPKIPPTSGPTPSRRATAGATSGQSATPAPDTWTGTISYHFAGTASGNDTDNIADSGTYDDSATYTVVLSRDLPTPSGMSWSAAGGSATGSVDDDLLQSDQGTSQRSTWKGSDWATVPQGACTLTSAADGHSYSLECHPITFNNIQYVLYEPGGGGIYDGPMPLTWSADDFTIKDIPPPSGSGGLFGSRKVDTRVRTGGSATLPVQADIIWNLTPASGPAPTNPPDVTGSVKVDGPPLGVSITQPGQRVVVGLPLDAAQKVTVKVTGNMIGAVKVSLLKPGGSLVSVDSSSAGSFDLGTQTATTSGTYSIVVEARPGGTGAITLAASSQ
jgi:hypothetical protein